MVFWYDLSLKEAAQELGYTVEEVEGCYKDALRQLKQLLGNDFDNADQGVSL
jgi:hypothetical protein